MTPFRRLAAIWAALVGASAALALVLPAAADRERSPRTVHYGLDATLDPVAHVVTGRGTITWRNDASVSVPDLAFHLYLNAFRDAKSTFLRERGPAGRTAFHEAHPGSIEVTSLRLAGGEDLTPGLAFVSPDDGNADDRTVARVSLPRPVPPGDEVVLEVAFTSRLPQVVARSGFGGDFHMVAQWFPKLGVFEDAGRGRAAGWNCHQYHATSEFFADYGVYDVRLTVPASYAGRVGATGSRAGPPSVDAAHGTVTYGFHAEDVHDFAWVAGERFDVVTDRFEGGFGTDLDGREAARVARILGRSVESEKLPAVDVTFLLAPEHADQVGRWRSAVFHALTYMGLWFGPYPYPTLTVVDPDPRAPGAGGMEYPTLITAGSGYVLAEKGIDPEFVLVHEFGHQHFYGLLGSDEFEDAWMDEGMNTWATARTLERAYGPRALVPMRWWSGRPLAMEPPLEFPGLLAGLRRAVPWLESEVLPFGRVGVVRDVAGAMGGVAPDRIALWPSGAETTPLSFLRDLPLLTHLESLPHTLGEHERVRFQVDGPDTDELFGRSAWQYLDARAYANHTYRRTAALLRTLEGLVDEETMIRLMRTYAERWRFRHPTPEDFVRTATEVGGASLGGFFDELARGSPVLDFGVPAIDVGEKDDKGVVESVVTVRRYGDARFPTVVWVRFDDGAVRRLRWERDDRVVALDGGAAVETLTPPSPDGQYRWTKIRFRGQSAVQAATTDPERLVGLEADRTNDGRRVAANPGAADRLAVRVLGWVEQITTFYGGL